MFPFCVLHLNKIKVMAEKQMRPREHIDRLKILREVITANICSMKSHRILLYGWLICLPGSRFLVLVSSLFAYDKIFFALDMYSDPFGWIKVKWSQQDNVFPLILVCKRLRLYHIQKFGIWSSVLAMQKKCFCAYMPLILQKTLLVVLVFRKMEKKELSALWCKIPFIRNSLLHLCVKKTAGIFSVLEA